MQLPCDLSERDGKPQDKGSDGHLADTGHHGIDDLGKRHAANHSHRHAREDAGHEGLVDQVGGAAGQYAPHVGDDGDGEKDAEGYRKVGDVWAVG